MRGVAVKRTATGAELATLSGLLATLAARRHNELDPETVADWALADLGVPSLQPQIDRLRDLIGD